MKYELSRRSWGIDETEESWTLGVDQGSPLLTGPHGERVLLSHHPDPQSLLEEIRLRAHGALEVRSHYTTQIMASDDLIGWLPIFLYATDKSPSEDGPYGGSDSDWSAIDNYDNEMSDLFMGAASDLMIHVGRQPWAVVDGSDGRLVVPAEGDQFSGLLTTWASWSWIEQGSMTSGYDSAWIGTLTLTLGASHDQIDEGGSQWRVFPLDNPIGAIVDWLTSGWLISQLRDTWIIESGDDPLIRGFIEMLADGSPDIEFFGTDYAKGDGIGLTDTAHWEAQCALGSRQRKALLRALQALPGTPRQRLS